MADFVVWCVLVAYALIVLCATPWAYAAMRQFHRDEMASKSWWKEWRKPYRRPW